MKDSLHWADSWIHVYPGRQISSKISNTPCVCFLFLFHHSSAATDLIWLQKTDDC